jgi:hypothetical protein
VDNFYAVINRSGHPTIKSNLKITKTMNKKLSVGMGIFALMLALAIGTTSVMASDTTSSNSFVGKCGQTIQKGYGMMSDAIANLLGMSQEEIQTERESGKSIAEIAQEKDITEQILVDSMLEAKTQRFQEAVTNGYLTLEQADERLEWMKEKIEGKMENGGGRFGRGGCNGGCHQ